MSAVYSIFTSPTHPPIPDHLPTLIVTPHGKPAHVLYTYLHTNQNRENYLLTPSDAGDLCVAKLFPPSSSSRAALSSSRSASSSSASSSNNPHANSVKCEASRNLRWSMSNTGIQNPVYKALLDQDGVDQPLFQVSKPNPNANWWTLFYFTYAGHLIPPKRVEFGRIQKNPIEAGGGTRVAITGKTDEEKAVWKTLGDGNEDMVEWIVLCAALTVLDDEIVLAAERAGLALNAGPVSSSSIGRPAPTSQPPSPRKQLSQSQPPPQPVPQLSSSTNRQQLSSSTSRQQQQQLSASTNRQQLSSSTNRQPPTSQSQPQSQPPQQQQYLQQPQQYSAPPPQPSRQYSNPSSSASASMPRSDPREARYNTSQKPGSQPLPSSPYPAQQQSSQQYSQQKPSHFAASPQGYYPPQSIQHAQESTGRQPSSYRPGPPSQQGGFYAPQQSQQMPPPQLPSNGYVENGQQYLGYSQNGYAGQQQRQQQQQPDWRQAPSQVQQSQGEYSSKRAPAPQGSYGGGGYGR